MVTKGVFDLSSRLVAGSDIENFENYPEDYRLFVTEIGNLEVNNGYWALAMQNPLPYKSMDRDLNNWTEELATVWCSDSDRFADHLPVVSLPCDNDTFAFDTKTIPYQLVDMYNEEKLSDFLDWIVMVLVYRLLFQILLVRRHICVGTSLKDVVLVIVLC